MLDVSYRFTLDLIINERFLFSYCSTTGNSSLAYNHIINSATAFCEAIKALIKTVCSICSVHKSKMFSRICLKRGHNFKRKLGIFSHPLLRCQKMRHFPVPGSEMVSTRINHRWYVPLARNESSFKMWLNLYSHCERKILEKIPFTIGDRSKILTSLMLWCLCPISL